MARASETSGCGGKHGALAVPARSAPHCDRRRSHLSRRAHHADAFRQFGALLGHRWRGYRRRRALRLDRANGAAWSHRVYTRPCLRLLPPAPAAGRCRQGELLRCPCRLSSPHPGTHRRRGWRAHARRLPDPHSGRRSAQDGHICGLAATGTAVGLESLL